MARKVYFVKERGKSRVHAFRSKADAKKWSKKWRTKITEGLL